MSGTMKIILAFLGGAVAGAAGVCACSTNKMDFGKVKPLAKNLMMKGMDLKETVSRQVETMRENMEDLAAEARDQYESAKEAKVTSPAAHKGE